jgi:drug/metabolite transporter (DMT)-like permease
MGWGALPRIEILAAAVLFSTGGAAIKACALNGWQVASFRSGVAALTLLVLAPASRRLLHWRAVVVGGAYAACLTLFVVANKNTTAANTIFLQSAAPLYILLLSPWLLAEPIRRRDVALMATLGTGMVFLVAGSGPAGPTAPHPGLGNALAALSGVFWALTVMGLRWMARHPAPGLPTAAAAVVAGNLTAFVVLLPLALPVGAARPADWGIIAYLGIFQIGLAYLCLTSAVRRVPALDVALLLLLEPVLNPLWAWWLQGEAPGPWSLLGGAIILAGTTIHALRG